MEIADEPRPGPARRRSRWVLAASIGLVGLGSVILGLSLQPPEAPGLAAAPRHLATHAADAAVVPGLAFHRPEGTRPGRGDAGGRAVTRRQPGVDCGRGRLAAGGDDAGTPSIA